MDDITSSSSRGLGVSGTGNNQRFELASQSSLQTKESLDPILSGSSRLPYSPPNISHPTLSAIRYRLYGVYRRLFTVVFCLNLVAFIYVCKVEAGPTLPSLGVVAIPISANIFIAILFRTDYFINFLYDSVAWVPHSLPLSIRRHLAKVYHFGGVHSGAGVASALWSLLFVVRITQAITSGEPVGIAALVVTYVLVVLLLAIITVAHPAFRRRLHNHFEAIHRLCGWLALALLWALILFLNFNIATVTSQSLAKVLFTGSTSAIIYLHILTTFLTILPWLRLRSVSAYAVQLSSHATRIYFQHPAVGRVQGIRISTSPLLEWHSFAAIPCSSAFQASPEVHLPNPTLSILISHAGDWTRTNITNPIASRHYWIRGVPITGVALCALLFRRVVVVTTGSGIGPVLSLLAGVASPPTSHSKVLNRTQSRQIPCHLIWSAPGPQQTFGQELVNEIQNIDPEAVIWDSRKNGRPDLVALTWQGYKDFGAEAVIVISNGIVTANTVYELESRGVPAYGPIFDS